MPEYNLFKIITAIDTYLDQTDKTSVDPVEANAMLAQKGILSDSHIQPGLPLRKILRKGEIPHAYQPRGRNSGWIIPRSNLGKKPGQVEENKIK